MTVWSVVDGRQVLQLKGHKGMVIGVDISPDGRTIVSCGEDLTIRVWDVATGQQRHLLRGHQRRVNRCRFLQPNEGEPLRFVSTSSDQTARIWDADNGLCLQVLAGHEKAVVYACETPLGLVTTSVDHTLRVWDVDLYGTMEEPVERMIHGTWRVWDGKRGRLQQTFYLDEQLISFAQHPDQPDVFLLAGKLGLHLVRYQAVGK